MRGLLTLKTVPDRLILANRHTCEKCIRDAGGTCGAPCPCPVDGASAVTHAVRGNCPVGKFAGATVGKVVPGRTVSPELAFAFAATIAEFKSTAMAVMGPLLWAEMHRKTDADQAYVDSVTRRLPCGECKSWFRAYLKEHPPRFDDWARWVWECHNAANAKLGKPMLTFDAASLRCPPE